MTTVMVVRCQFDWTKEQPGSLSSFYLPSRSSFPSYFPFVIKLTIDSSSKLVINNGLVVGLLSVLVHRIGRRIEYVFYLIKENKFVLIFLFGFSECGHSGDSHNFFFFFYHFFILKHCFVIIFFQLERGGGCR